LSNYYIFDTVQTGSSGGISIYWIGGRLFFSVSNGRGGEYVIRTNVIQDVLWHSYAVVYNGNIANPEFIVYRDGIVIDSLNFSVVFFNAVTLNLSSGVIGRRKDGTNYMTGELGHLMLFNNSLTAGQIEQLNTYY
jgi:hypothetical protein